MNWLKQRTTWVGISGVAAGAILIWQGNLETGVQTVIGGLSVIFLREAITKASK